MQTGQKIDLQYDFVSKIRSLTIPTVAFLVTAGGYSRASEHEYCSLITRKESHAVLNCLLQLTIQFSKQTERRLLCAIYYITRVSI